MLVKVAAFYFGARSVQAAQGLQESPEIFVNPSGEGTLKKTGTQIITVKPKPDSEGYTPEIIGDDIHQALSQDGNTFTYTPKNAEVGDTVTIKFSLKKYPEVSEELKLTIEDEQTEETEQVEEEEKSLEIESPSGDAKAQVGIPLTIKCKTKPDNKEVKGDVDQDKGTLEKVVDTKAEFKFTPSQKSAVGDEITLTFTLDEDSSIKETLKVTIEAKE